MGICSSHPRPFRKAPLVISFSCLRFTGLKSSSFWGTGRPLVTVAFNYSLTPSRGCQFKLDRTRGTFPRLSMIPMLPRWLKLTCAHGVGCLSPSQLHGVLSVCVVAQLCSLCSPMDCPPAPLSIDFFFLIFQARMLEWASISYSRGSSWPGSTCQALASSAPAVRFLTTGTTTVCYNLFFFSFFQDEALPTKPLLISPRWSVMCICLGAYSSTLVISLARLPQ